MCALDVYYVGLKWGIHLVPNIGRTEPESRNNIILLWEGDIVCVRVLTEGKRTFPWIIIVSLNKYCG